MRSLTLVSIRANPRGWNFRERQVAEKSNNCPTIEKSERKAIMSKFSELLVRFLKEARNDLGIHPSP
jgi:hypothetical protein